MSSPSPKHWLIIPAAGVGSRMQSDRPKQYLRIADKTILEHTLSCFEGQQVFENILLGIAAEDSYIKTLGLAEKFPAVRLYSGGAERAQTVLNGLAALSADAQDDDWVWVHDAARPCLSGADIAQVLEQLEQAPDGLVLSVPVSDTLKRSETSTAAHKKDLFSVASTVDRSSLWRAMTPQVFRYARLRDALSACLAKGVQVTDESSAIESAGGKPLLVQGSDENIKVTLAADLPKVEAYLKRSTQAAGQTTHESAAATKLNKRLSMMQIPKIGTGFDVHAFGEGDAITLGGVSIPYQHGLIAHSDGDVLLHAIMDALLGALALGDIGKHFPDTDLRWKGADSRELLRQVRRLTQEQGYLVGNIDSTIIAQAPKMAPFIAQMQENIAADLNLPLSCVSIKATTTERLGFTGRKEGIACQASALLVAESAMRASS